MSHECYINESSMLNKIFRINLRNHADLDRIRKLWYLLLRNLLLPVPHPYVFWYRLDGMGTQKNAPKKQKSFQETHISFIKCVEHQIFLDTQLQLLGVFWISLNYPILNFKKRVCPKNVWIRHWLLLPKFLFWRVD